MKKYTVKPYQGQFAVVTVFENGFESIVDIKSHLDIALAIATKLRKHQEDKLKGGN
jgi:hypothetical protein